MPTISPILPNDGEAIDASDVNTPFNIIIGLLNGNLDEQNIKPGSLSWNVMSNFQNQIPSAALQDNANLGKFKKDANISFIPEGLIWSHVTGLNASMTAGRYYSNSGDIVSITAIPSKAFNSKKDTYIYVGQNGTINYSSVDNNAARPSLPANSNWLAKVVTNDSTITSIIDMRQTRLVGVHNIDFTTMPMFAATTSKWNALAGGGVSIVNYNSVEYDTMNMFNKSTHQATIPVDGIYTISAKAAVTSAGYNPSATATVMVYKNGAMLEEMTRIAGSGNGLTLMRLSHTLDVLLKKGDVIDVRAHCSESRDYGGPSTHSRFSMRFVGNSNTSNG
jgi:hypothetical protein